jgi:hypothetical protein
MRYDLLLQSLRSWDISVSIVTGLRSVRLLDESSQVKDVSALHLLWGSPVVDTGGSFQGLTAGA